MDSKNNSNKKKRGLAGTKQLFSQIYQKSE